MQEHLQVYLSSTLLLRGGGVGVPRRCQAHAADCRAPGSMVAYALPLYCYAATASGPGRMACPSDVARVFRGEVPDAAVPCPCFMSGSLLLESGCC